MARAPRNFATMGEAADLPNLAAVKAYRGKAGEPIFDRVRLRMQDGVTNGGIAMAVCRRRVITGANSQIDPGDAYVAITTLAVAATLALPAASAFEPGQPLYVADETGLCSFDAGLTITVSALGADRIAGQPSIVMGSPFQKLTFHSNGSNLWTFA